jgi:hypothetical protein
VCSLLDRPLGLGEVGAALFWSFISFERIQGLYIIRSGSPAASTCLQVDMLKILNGRVRVVSCEAVKL